MDADGDALGMMEVPVMRRIGERVQEVDAIDA